MSSTLFFCMRSYSSLFNDAVILIGINAYNQNHRSYNYNSIIVSLLLLF